MSASSSTPSSAPEVLNQMLQMWRRFEDDRDIIEAYGPDFGARLKKMAEDRDEEVEELKRKLKASEDKVEELAQQIQTLKQASPSHTPLTTQKTPLARVASSRSLRGSASVAVSFRDVDNEGEERSAKRQAVEDSKPEPLTINEVDDMLAEILSLIDFPEGWSTESNDRFSQDLRSTLAKLTSKDDVWFKLDRAAMGAKPLQNQENASSKLCLFSLFSQLRNLMESDKASDCPSACGKKGYLCVSLLFAENVAKPFKRSRARNIDDSSYDKDRQPSSNDGGKRWKLLHRV